MQYVYSVIVGQIRTTRARSVELVIPWGDGRTLFPVFLLRSGLDRSYMVQTWRSISQEAKSFRAEGSFMGFGVGMGFKRSSPIVSLLGFYRHSISQGETGTRIGGFCKFTPCQNRLGWTG